MTKNPRDVKILMQNRIDLYEKGGGDLIQMLKTKEGLERLGVKVEISTDLKADLSKYDLVHLFNVSRVHETYMQFLNAKKQKKKIVISPIYHSLKEMDIFRRKGQSGFFKILNFFFHDYYSQEIIKNMVRYLSDRRQRKAIMLQLLKGFKNEQKEVLKEADAWILLAEQEGNFIEEELEVHNSHRFIIPNGVDSDFLSLDKINHQIKEGMKIPFTDFVLCVGRIEPRKNQINLIKALKGTGLNLVFIGGVNKNYEALFNKSYLNEFKKLLKSEKWVVWLNEKNHQEIDYYYKLAKVHVNPSWFEVLSLTNLEAAANNCMVVLSDVGCQKEYFQNEVFYCQPDDLKSIRKAVLKAYLRAYESHETELNNRIKESYNWNVIAQKTLAVYQYILN